MKDGTVVAVTCPICGHHLVGRVHTNREPFYITALCPLCDENFTFDVDKEEIEKE